MPLKLNVGLSQKVGEANFGSRGACVNFEVELEPILVREPDQLREKIRYLFGLAKQSVEEELNGHTGHETNGHDDPGNGSQPLTKTRPATASQVRAIHAIADRNRIDLVPHLRKQLGVDQADELSITQASQLIDELKSKSNGTTGGRR